MARPHVGLPALSGNLERYAERFDLLEVRLTVPLPKAATLRAWRKKVPPGFVFSVVLPTVVGELRPSAELDDALAKSLEIARALEARCIVLVTPPSITPTDLNKRRLEAVLAKVPRDAVTVAWEPRGVWEVEQAAPVAQKLGVVLVVDAVHDAPPKGVVAYIRVRGLGESTRLGPAAIDRIADAVRGRRESYVVVESGAPAKVAEAIRSRAARRGTKGGVSTVVRPAVLRAEDEEQ